MVETVEAGAKVVTPNSFVQFPYTLVSSLQRLDQLLARAVAKAEVKFGSEAAADRFRGLYISRSEVERLLSRAPGAPFLFAAEMNAGDALEDSRLAFLRQHFGLTPFDLDLIIVALAPEIDLRYERIYAYLQDDVTRKRPTIDLALDLLCDSAEAKLLQRVHFAPDAPLMRTGLLHLIPDSQQTQSPLLSHYLKLDDQLVRMLLGQKGLDPRLVPLAQLIEPTVLLDKLPHSDEMKHALLSLVLEAKAMRQPLKMYFHGPHGVGKAQTAEALAMAAGMHLLKADLARVASADMALYRVLFREALFQNALLYLSGFKVGDHESSLDDQHLLDVWAEDKGITIVSSAQGWTPLPGAPRDVIVVPFTPPDFAQRRKCWEASLRAQSVTIGGDVLDLVAGNFQLTPEQIADAVVLARQRVRWRAAAQPQAETNALAADAITLADLLYAAQRQSGHDLEKLTQKIELVHDWQDLVLPPDSLTQLREVCRRVIFRPRVLGEWGFGHKLSLGRGISALFTGPSGTGKTMAAEIIANELGLELYKIDLSSVVSKYIGETEKNLERIFTAADNANAILFFDEADALFGKRSEVRDSHDRYANVEIAYLLQKMEQYEGVAILATNLRQNMDDAFVRRLQFIVEFPFPDEAQRYQIWRIHFPRQAPRDDEIDYAFLARQFRLSGGNIKNIVLSAAFFAAADGGRIGMDHLIHATQREYQKMGYVLSDAELGKYRDRMQSSEKVQ